jgi:hypothetical protein
MVVSIISFARGKNSIKHSIGKNLMKQAWETDLFDNISLFTDEYLKQNLDFWSRHAEFIEKNSRGYGCYIWKPYLIKKSMEQMQNGDKLLWMDCGCYFDTKNKDILAQYLNQIETDYIIGSEDYIEREYTKGELILKLGMLDAKYLETPQRLSRTILFLVCDKTRELVNEWYELSCDYHLIDYSINISQLLYFKEHRNEQAIFSLLTKKYNLFSEHPLNKAIHMFFYTIKGKTDGFCAQYLAVLSGIAFCKYKNYIYVHTPFTKFEHNIDVNTINQLVGINNNCIVESDLLPLNQNEIIEKQFEGEVHWHKKPSIYYTDEVLKMIRKYYFSTEKPIIPNIDIAIHIRRGDVDENCKDRYINDTIYINIINSLKIKFPFYTITVFSEGKHENFSKFGLEEKYVILNNDVCQTFHSLVSSKILVMSKSNLSYCAALLNENTVYYNDFWHKPLDNWLNIESIINV